MEKLEVCVFTPDEIPYGAVVELVGEFDAETMKLFTNKVNPLIAEKKKKFIIFDIGKLTFIDSTALGVLIDLVKKCEKGPKLAFTELNGQVKEVIELVELDKIVPNYAHNLEAMKAMVK